MKMSEKQCVYATFFVEDFFHYVLNKNVTKWELIRSEYFEVLHKFMPQCYRFQEDFVRAVVLAFENYREVISNETNAIWNVIQNARELERPSKLCLCIEKLSIKFGYESYENFILFLAIVLRVCIRSCDEGQESLISAVVYITAKRLTELTPGNLHEMFVYIRDSASFFLENDLYNIENYGTKNLFSLVQ